MPSHYPAQLVLLDGADAVAFAQAQFSSNLSALANGQWQFSAWLDSQGRVRALFHLLRLDDLRLCLLLRGGDAASLVDALRRYVFRSRVRIEALPVRSLGTGAAMPLHTLEQRDDALALGCGSYSLQVGSPGDDDWRLPQLRARWPWLPDNLLGELLPASLGLEALGATALDKGCYPGQEIVARLHYRGGNKRHLRRLRLSRTLPPGSLLREHERAAVQLLDVVPGDASAEALAVVHDEVAAPPGEGIHLAHEGQAVVAWDIDEHEPGITGA